MKKQIPKIIALIIVLVTLSASSYAQSRKIDLSVEQFKEGKYEVKIITVPTAMGYGYEIFAEGKLLATQIFKPYFDKPSLFSSIKNAKIIAKYHVANIDEKKPEKINIDLAKAIELGVSEEDLITKKLK